MAEERGMVFIGPAEKVYAGQIIGLNKRQEDMEMNVCKAKHLTNMRSSSSDGVVQLTPPTILSLEQCLDFIEKDELLEVTPKSLRLRKRELDPNKRKRQK
jgi:GTP-binding protein